MYTIKKYLIRWTIFLQCLTFHSYLSARKAPDPHSEKTTPYKIFLLSMLGGTALFAAYILQDQKTKAYVESIKKKKAGLPMPQPQPSTTTSKQKSVATSYNLFKEENKHFYNIIIDKSPKNRLKSNHKDQGTDLKKQSQQKPPSTPLVVLKQPEKINKKSTTTSNSLKEKTILPSTPIDILHKSKQQNIYKEGQTPLKDQPKEECIITPLTPTEELIIEKNIVPPTLCEYNEQVFPPIIKEDTITPTIKRDKKDNEKEEIGTALSQEEGQVWTIEKNETDRISSCTTIEYDTHSEKSNDDIRIDRQPKREQQPRSLSISPSGPPHSLESMKQDTPKIPPKININIPKKEIQLLTPTTASPSVQSENELPPQDMLKQLALEKSIEDIFTKYIPESQQRQFLKEGNPNWFKKKVYYESDQEGLRSMSVVASPYSDTDCDGYI